MNDVKKSSIYQGVRCFVSLDLSESTRLKNDNPIIETDEKKMRGGGSSFDWLSVIVEFLESASLEFLGNQNRIEYDDAPSVKMNFWRSEGDEVLFYSDRLHSQKQITTIFANLADVVKSLDNRFYINYNLGVKGAIWAAGFPRRNVEFQTSNEPPYVRLIPSPFHDVGDHFEKTPFLGPDGRMDFLGLEIDLGFRLKEHTQPGRIVSSFDIVRFIAENQASVRSVPVRIHLVGWSPLKGIYNDRLYPIFWLDKRKATRLPEKRTVLEAAQTSYGKEFLENPKSQLDIADIFPFYEEYVRETNGDMIKMYVIAEDMVDAHVPGWEEVITGARK